jgi:hypothetical protein
MSLATEVNELQGGCRAIARALQRSQGNDCFGPKMILALALAVLAPCW